VSEQSETPEAAPEPATEQIAEPAAAAPAPTGAAPPPPESPVELPPPLPASGAGAAADRPEIAVGAAFAGGFALAMILRRLAR
jgi:hypothetical protein